MKIEMAAPTKRCDECGESIFAQSSDVDFIITFGDEEGSGKQIRLCRHCFRNVSGQLVMFGNRVRKPEDEK